MSAPTEKPALSVEQETARGVLLAQILGLRHSRANPDRYLTKWGTKTDLGLFRVVARIVEDGE